MRPRTTSLHTHARQRADDAYREIIGSMPDRGWPQDPHKRPSRRALLRAALSAAYHAENVLMSLSATRDALMKKGHAGQEARQLTALLTIEGQELARSIAYIKAVVRSSNYAKGDFA